MFYTKHNLSFAKVQDMFLKDDTYLLAMDNDNVVTLTLSYSDTKMNDFNELTDSELSEVARNFKSQRDETVVFNTSTQDEAGKDMVWLYFGITVHDKDNNTDKKQYQATTVCNGKSIVLTVYRNEGNVEATDLDMLKSITKSVGFDSKSSDSNNKKLMMYIIIGAGALAVIILIIIIIVTVKKSKRKKAKTRNDKILEELADKYQSRPAAGKKRVEPPVQKQRFEPVNEIADEAESGRKPVDNSAGETKIRYADPGESLDDVVPKRRYSDEDIARLLGDLEDDENFNFTLPETEADSVEDTEVRDSVIENADAISEFFEDEDEAAAAAAEQPAVSAYIEVSSDDERETAPSVEEKAEDVIPADNEPAEEEPRAEEPFAEETPAESETPSDNEESSEDEAPVEYVEPAEPEAPGEEAEEASSDNAEDGEALPEEDSDSDDREADEEFEEFVNDEVLAREESKQEHFKSSNDFFEEAPRRVIGVISSREIAEAEEYDVIGEVEQRAEEIEREPQTKQRRSFLGSLKSFRVHCGYFATNVKRAIRRKRAESKRRKAEKERRRRQIERQRQQRAVQQRRRESNGLVQVHSRDDRPRSKEQL